MYTQEATQDHFGDLKLYNSYSDDNSTATVIQESTLLFSSYGFKLYRL